MEKIIYKFLIKEKIPRSIVGFFYISEILKILCINKRWQKCNLNELYNILAEKEGITGYGIRGACQYAKESSKSYSNMTMKEWFCWAAIECSKDDDEEEEEWVDYEEILCDRIF